MLTILLVLLGGIMAPLSAQTCQEKLIQASNAYDNGDMPLTIKLATDCTVQGDESERVNAWRLLAMAYLVTSEREKALNAAEQMLKINPKYQPDLLNEPKDFTQLLQEIKVIPAFSLGGGFLFGNNGTNPEAIRFYAPSEYTKTYSNKAGIHFGVSMGYNFNSRHGVSLGILSKTWKYNVAYQVFGNDVSLDETIRTIDLPLMYQYSLLNKNRFSMNVSAGGYGNLLMNSFNDLHLKNNEGGSEIKHYSSTVRRNKLNAGICGSLGGRLQTQNKRGQWRFDVAYFKGLTNITKTASRYDNQTLIYDFFYLDDDLRLNNLGVSISYQFNIKYTVKR
ncbi:MAG: PorT family protein [Bacteroidetes bacterium]|nr:PorT family protein [Bacteroidota bacterium]